MQHAYPEALEAEVRANLEQKRRDSEVPVAAQHVEERREIAYGIERVIYLGLECGVGTHTGQYRLVAADVGVGSLVATWLPLTSWADRGVALGALNARDERCREIARPFVGGGQS